MVKLVPLRPDALVCAKLADMVAKAQQQTCATANALQENMRRLDQASAARAQRGYSLTIQVRQRASSFMPTFTKDRRRATKNSWLTKRILIQNGTKKRR
jgi:nitrate reductase assembly molybdenum cofactor insertion protein NarJ